MYHILAVKLQHKGKTKDMETSPRHYTYKIKIVVTILSLSVFHSKSTPKALFTVLHPTCLCVLLILQDHCLLTGLYHWPSSAVLFPWLPTTSPWNCGQIHYLTCFQIALYSTTDTKPHFHTMHVKSSLGLRPNSYLTCSEIAWYSITDNNYIFIIYLSKIL